MKRKKKLVVLTGAGMSAESGLATFRGSGGMWDNYRVEEVATPEAWESNPQLVIDFYNHRRKELIKSHPNRGHKILAELEEHFDIEIITQNVDNLHEKAGSSQVLHIHGELMKVRSTGPGGEIFELSENNIFSKIGDLCPNKYQLRPHIVWFGEPVPLMYDAIEIAKQAEIFLIIGTSMQVYPAASLIDYVPDDSPIYLIDPNETTVYNSSINFILKGASEGMEFFKNMVLK